MKKILTIVLIITILVSQFSYPIGTIGVSAKEVETTVATKYFYNQLSDNNKKVFYKAMEVMLEKGFFKTGNTSIEVTGLDVSVGEESLLKDMGAARDAFMLDYPELFYVDFDYLSIRVTSDESGKHVYLGTGRGNNYINKEFLKNDGSVDTSKINTAITTVNSRIEDIVKKAKDKDVKEQIKIAHDEVIKAAKYTLEYHTNYPYTVRTVYGVFGFGNTENTGNAVCEGYARALKAILDKLGINSILVRGTYKTKDNKQEEHMWVYVQVGNQWYGVDPTFDNDSEDKSGIISSEYFLASADVMRNHYPIGIISTSDYQFEYPELYGGVTEDTNTYDKSEYEKGQIIYKDASGLSVKYESNIDINGYKSETAFSISYNGMGYKEARKAGYYIVIDGWQVMPDMSTGSKNEEHTGWNYPTEITPEYQYIFEDRGTDFVMRADRYTAFQVGVTKVAPGKDFDKVGVYDVTYKGGISELITYSEAIDTDRGEFEYPQPFVKKTTPAITVKQLVGKAYHISVEYDQDLVYKDDNKEKKIGVEVLLYDLVYGYRTADESTMQYKITEPKLASDKRTITFDFTPSKLWSLDETIYLIKFTGIKGAISGKDPNTVGYAVYNPTTGCIYQLSAMGVDMEAYGKPKLMDDFELKDILSDEFKAAEGITDEVLQKYGDLLMHRLSLVTTTTKPSQEKEMKDKLDKELASTGRTLADSTGDKVNVEMYNIALSLCKCQLEKLKDGIKIKIMLGFPLGYGPDDAGVTFKAYHYKDNGDGTYTIEEIPCTVTALGLIIEVDSFSPFAIAAVKKVEADDEDISITFNVTEGGKVTTNNLDGSGIQKVGSVKNYYIDKNGIKHYDENDTRRFTVTADPGYKIESVEKITNIEIDDTGKMTGYNSTPVKLDKNNSFTVDYNNVSSLGDNYKVTFIAKNTGSIGDPETGEIEDSEGNQTTNPGSGTVGDQPGGNSSGNNQSANVSSESNSSNDEGSQINSDNSINNPQTSVMDVRAYIILAIVSLAGIICIKKKKRNIALSKYEKK